MQLVDTRHEQTAAFAAEGWAKVTRHVGVAALTAGPGVTNGISAITTAHLNGSPVVVVGGRAPQARWGAGSLQELDHVPIVASITKHTATATDADTVPGDARRGALAPPAAPPRADSSSTCRSTAGVRPAFRCRPRRRRPRWPAATRMPRRSPRSPASSAGPTVPC